MTMANPSSSGCPGSSSPKPSWQVWCRTTPVNTPSPSTSWPLTSRLVQLRLLCLLVHSGVPGAVLLLCLLVHSGVPGAGLLLCLLVRSGVPGAVLLLCLLVRSGVPGAVLLLCLLVHSGVPDAVLLLCLLICSRVPDAEIQVPSSEKSELSKILSFRPGVGQTAAFCAFGILPGILPS